MYVTICCLRRTHSTPAQIVQSTVSLGPQSRERFPIRTADPANWAENECHARAAVVRSNPLSGDSLCKTGIFADVAGGFCRLRPPYLQTKGPGTESKARKAGISGPFSPFLGNLGQRRNGWLGREGSNLRMVESKSTALPLGYAPTGRSGRHGTIATQYFPATSVYRGSPAVSTDNRPDFGWNRAQATRIPAPVAIRPFILGLLPRLAAAEPRIGTVCIPGAPEYRALTPSTNAPPPLPLLATSCHPLPSAGRVERTAVS